MHTDVIGMKLDRAGDFERATYRKISWRLIPFLLLCYVCSYLDRVNVGFAKLQMLSELKFSESVYGLGAGIFFIGYFLFEVPSNVILHRVGARKWIARIMITWGVLSAGMMFVQSESSFYILRFFLGAAEAGFFPGIILYLTYWFPAQRRGRATSLFLTALPISGIIGGPLSGWVLRDFHGLHGWSGWQWLFLIEGLPSVLVGLLVLVYLDDRVKDARWLDDAEKQLITHNIAVENRGKIETSLRATLTNGRVWHLAALYFSLVISLYGVSFWMPTLIKGLGVKDALDVGLLSAIPWICGMVAMVLTARSADRNNERRWHIAIPALIGATGFFISVSLHQDLVISMLGLTIATMGILSSLPLFWSLPTAILGGASAAAGIALINSVGNLSGFLGPYVVGMIKEATHSTDAGMYMLALFLVLGALLTLLVPAALLRQD
ncbi:MAG: MFS transporter [Pseudomonadota bacterium]